MASGALRTSAQPRPVIDRNDLAALMFTSGSTGTPYGVMVSTATSSQIPPRSSSACNSPRAIACWPFCPFTTVSALHSFIPTYASAQASCSISFYVSRSDPRSSRDSPVHRFCRRASHFQILLRKSTLAQRRFPALRYVQQAGGLLAPTLIDELRTALPGTDVVVMYGQTEATARLSYLPPQYLDVKRGSIGRGIPGVRLRVLSGAGHEVQSGEVGEITAEGDNITLGYWNAPDRVEYALSRRPSVYRRPRHD